MDSVRLIAVTDESAVRKAALIQEALTTLRAAQHLDERDELADLDAASFLAWYDRTIPDVRDIKILAGAMEIELARRRGERIEKEGDLRGRPKNVTPGVTFKSESVRQQRSRDRVLAEQPAAVDAFVQREVRKGQVPTVKGAVRAAKAARAISTPIKQKKPSSAAPSSFAESVRAEVHARIEQVQGEPLTEAELAQRWGGIHPTLVRRYVRDAALYGDVRKEKGRNTLTLTPALVTVSAYLRSLREEITRKRKEYHDERRKARWDSRLISTRVQSDLLDWIEDQLDRVPSV